MILGLSITYCCTDRSRVFVRSRAPYSTYMNQDTLIRGMTFEVGHLVIRSRVFRVGHLYRVGHLEQDKRLYRLGPSEENTRIYSVGYSEQGQRIVHRYSTCQYSKYGTSDSYVSFRTMVKNLLKDKTESTVNKALIKMIITDPLRIAELTFLLYCSCLYSEQQVCPTQNIVELI